jgi:hypothetical protein
MTKELCFDPRQGQETLHLQFVQTDSETHPASSLLTDSRGCFHRSKAATLLSLVEIRNEWISTPVAHAFILCKRKTLSYTSSHSLFTFTFFSTKITKAADTQYGNLRRNGIYFGALKH